MGNGLCFSTNIIGMCMRLMERRLLMSIGVLANQIILVNVVLEFTWKWSGVINPLKNGMIDVVLYPTNLLAKRVSFNVQINIISNKHYYSILLTYIQLLCLLSFVY